MRYSVDSCRWQTGLGRWPRLGLLVLGVLLTNTSLAATATVAVAANFKPVADEIAAAFTKASGHQLRLTSGSTGKLYAQIVAGAPYDLFLAADQARPQKLVEAGLADAELRFTYAIGQLVLWSPSLPKVGPELLEDADFRHLAIANPKLAPYGAAANEVLATLGVSEHLTDKLVYGDSVGQAFAFVHSGNAELGFVAASQVLERAGGTWVPPRGSYTPIRQDAVVLTPSNAAAIAFAEFLQEDAARQLLRRYRFLQP